MNYAKISSKFKLMVTSKSRKIPYLPISAYKPQFLLAQMNLCVALSKKAQKLYIWIKTAIFYEFSNGRKMEMIDDRVIRFVGRIWVECNL